MSRRRKRAKSKKKLIYGIIAVIFILLCFATYSFLNQPNQTDETNGNQFSYEAAIVDHLSFREETKNETFKDSSVSILEAAGFDINYYPGEDVTVNFYRNLFSHNYGLIVLRVHSAIIGNSTRLGLFTSELFDESKYDTPSAPYYDDIVNAKPQRIVKAYFPDDPTQYFAISPEFIEKYGNFQNATVIMMGCDGLKYSTMAEAFRRKGAKICVGWDGLVSTPHTDHATTRLLQHLAVENTVNDAVGNTIDEVGREEMYFQDQGYNSTLKYYPIAAGGCKIKNTLGISDIDLMETNTVLVKKRKKLNQTSQRNIFL
jgi:hypothetical protein